MTENLPTTALGQDVLRKINSALQQFKHTTKPLVAIVMSKLVLLYENTKNPEHLADFLKGMRKLTGYDIEKINAKPTPYEKNQYIYDSMFSKIAAAELIRALEDTNNEQIIREFGNSAAPTDALDGKSAKPINSEVGVMNSPTMSVKPIPQKPAPIKIIATNATVSLNQGKKNKANQYQSITCMTSNPPVVSRGPVDVVALKEKVKGKIRDLENNKEDYPYIVFFDKNLDDFLDKTAMPDDLAWILCDAKVLNVGQRDNVKSKASNREKNKIIYDVIKYERKIDELITALGQLGDSDTLARIDDTASS